MEPKYKQAAELKASIENCFVDGRISAHWIADKPCFWYRRDVNTKSFAFITVDAETGRSEPAFDHAALASELSKHGVQASAATLPFREFETKKYPSTINFHVNDKLWQYESENNILSVHNMDDQDANHVTGVEPLEREVASCHKGPYLKCCFTFINKRSRAIKVWWVDYHGEPQIPSMAEPGKSCQRQTYNGHVWRVCDGETGDLIASYVASRQETAFVIIEEHTITPSGRVSTPDSDSILRCIVKDYNVYATGNDSPDVQLSSSGSKDTPFDPQHIYSSPDNSYACVWQYTPEQKRILYRIESTPRDHLQPRLTEKQYLKPGDKVRIDRPRLFDLAQEKEILVSDLLFGNPFALHDVGWSLDNQKYRFIYNERGHKVLRVVELDITGNARTLIEERQDTFIDHSEKVDWHYEADTDELIWLSERDGSNQLYLIKLDGAMDSDNQLVCLQLTHGPGNVHHIEHVDTKERQIFVAILGAVTDQDPYHMHLARVSMDDRNFTILTAGDGNHTWTWSPDLKYFVDEWSRVDKAPRTVLRDQNGKLILDMAESNLDGLTLTGWRAPERFTAPGRDGSTLIYGIIIKPSDFSPDKSYPVIEKIYAGPHGFFVPKSFSKLPKLYALAELGFIVVQIDGMGTNWRGRKFQEVCYQNLKDAGLPDRIAWLKAAASTRPWMDTTRVGIFGASAGGQNALSALLWHGDFYKAAIADCGCHDNRLDKLWWNEQWMGFPVNKTYEDNSNVVHAHRLTGALMLIVAEMDDNVDPASTLQVVHALNEAGKDYELLFVPGGRHVVGDSTKYLVRRQWDFFVRHLIGAETPRWNTAKVREELGICYD